MYLFDMNSIPYCIHELMFYTNVYAWMFFVCFFFLLCDVMKYVLVKLFYTFMCFLCNSRFKSSLELMLCVIDISTLNKTYLICYLIFDYK